MKCRYYTVNLFKAKRSETREGEKKHTLDLRIHENKHLIYHIKLHISHFTLYETKENDTICEKCDEKMTFNVCYFMYFYYYRNTMYTYIFAGSMATE